MATVKMSLTLCCIFVIAIEGEECNPPSGGSDEASSSQWLKMMRKDDLRMKSLLMMRLETDLKTMNQNDAKELLYKIFATPLRSYCKSLKPFGGRWFPEDGAKDGVKYVCMDQWHSGKNCLIYSLGVGDDTIFEEEMATIGCQVKMFDHTIEEPSISENLKDKIKWYPVEITHWEDPKSTIKIFT